MAVEDFQGDIHKFGFSEPPVGAFLPTLSDSVDQPFNRPIRSISVQVAGAVKVTMVNGDVVTIPLVAVGVQFPLRVSRIWTTGTTATGIVAYY
jgi:hypothetical protein